MLFRRKIGMSTIFPKLVAVFLLVIAPLYAISLWMNVLGESKVRHELNESLTSRVDFYLHTLETEMKHVTVRMQELTLDKDLQRFAYISDSMPLLEWSETVGRIENRLQWLKNASVYIKGANVHILTMNRTLSSEHSITDTLAKDYEAVAPSVPPELPENHLSFRQWQNRLFIGLAYPDAGLTSRPPSFVVSIEWDTEELKQTLRYMIDYNGSSAAVVNFRQGWSIESRQAANSASALQTHLAERFSNGEYQGLENVKLDGQSHVQVYRYSPELDAYLVVLVPENEVFGPIGAYRSMFWALSAVSVTVVVAFSYWIYRLIHMPLAKLRRSFRKVEEGHLEPADLPNVRNEFLYIFQHFNRMVERLKQMIQQVYEQKIRAQSSEMKQLQSQINPHFLYNTFFILYRLAKMKDNDAVVHMSELLGKYFQYITLDGSTNVPLATEAEHSLTYTKIQDIRFSGKIEVDFGEVPEECRDVQVPRLILQPIIENAYKHGLQNKRKAGLLRVEFACGADGAITITVEDNGENLSDQRLRELQAGLAGQWTEIEHTGLLNVHRRLQIMFGDNSGIALGRGELGGLRVEMSLRKRYERSTEAISF